MELDAGELAQLIDANQGFVRGVAGRVQAQLGYEAELDDLVAYGMQGLLEAAARYDGRPGNRFHTFAYYRVRGAMIDGVRRMSWTPRESERAPADLEDEVRSLAGALGEAARRLVTALDGLCEEDQPRAPSDPVRDLERAERGVTLERALAGLPHTERRLFELCYEEGRSIAEAGQVLGRSRSWASRLHARALGRLERSFNDA